MSSPKWLGVQVAMQSAIAVAKTVTAITKANPGVVTAAAHGYANGDYFLLNAQGMNEVNQGIFRAASIAADTVQLDGQDTTNFTAFSSGNMQKITFGTTFSTIKTVSGSGGEFETQDITTIHDLNRKTEPGFASALEYSFDSFWDLSDPALLACIAASKISKSLAFLFTFQNGQKMAFYGTVGASGIPAGSTGEKALTKIKITASGNPTYFAT